MERLIHIYFCDYRDVAIVTDYRCLVVLMGKLLTYCDGIISQISGGHPVHLKLTVYYFKVSNVEVASVEKAFIVNL